MYDGTVTRGTAVGHVVLCIFEFKVRLTAVCELETLAQYESPMSNGKKLCAALKFSQCRSKVTVKVTCSKFMVP